jgi:hypothetical protein
MSGLSGAKRWSYRTAALTMAALMGGSLATALVASPALAQAPNPAPAPGVSMGAAAQNGSAYLAYAGANRAVYLRNQASGTVTALGGQLIGGPAVVQTSTGLAVFGRGTDSALWWIHQTPSGAWSGWQSLGGIITSQPGAAAGVQVGFGPLVALARGANGALWYRVQATNGIWSAWRSLGGRLLAGTGPAAVNAQGNLAVAVIGTDHGVWMFGPMGMQFYGFTNLGGRTSSTPAVTYAAAAAKVVVFAQGTDNALWARESVLPIGSASPWTSLGGFLTSAPAATQAGANTYVFVLGTNNVLWMLNGPWPNLGSWTQA